MCVSGSSSLAKAILFIFLLLISLVVSANAAVITVDDDVGADYTTIQAAVNAASDGDTILVYPGTYVENVVIGEASVYYFIQNLTIMSQSGDPHDTIIQANDLNDPVFSIISSSGVSISGFNVTGDSSLYYGDCGGQHHLGQHYIWQGKGC